VRYEKSNECTIPDWDDDHASLRIQYLKREGRAEGYSKLKKIVRGPVDTSLTYMRSR